ncbi:MAG: hypothetical protein SGILL_000622 [Bacillariaceae sp.]
MKLSLAVNALTCMSFLGAIAPTFGAKECTQGKLFVSSTGDTSLRVFDLSKGIENLSVESTMNIPGTGPELNLNKDSSGKVVAVIYRGTEASNYQDGAVRWVDTGVSVEPHDEHAHIEYETPIMIDNAAFDCARAIHFVPHDSKIAIFCDGAITEDALVNTTVWVVDESLFGADESAVIFKTTLPSSHHGVAVPVDDDHVMYSLPSPERLAGNFSRSFSLPHTFEVVDYEGNVLHSIDDTSDVDRSCSGFHGSWAKENTFALACDDQHGGILVVDYDEGTAVYESRALAYPENFPDHRTGGFAEHHMAPLAVGNFAATGQAHLVRFDPTSDVSITDDNVMTLGEERQCAFKFEESEGQLLMVLMPDGTFNVYEVEPEWKLLVSEKIVPDMVDCAEVLFAPGYGQAFIMTGYNNKMYAIDLTHVDEGELETSETTLDFQPYSAVVAGAPEEAACKLSELEHDHEGGVVVQGSSAPVKTSVSAGMFLAIALIAMV